MDMKQNGQDLLEKLKDQISLEIVGLRTFIDINNAFTKTFSRVLVEHVFITLDIYANLHKLSRGKQFTNEKHNVSYKNFIGVYFDLSQMSTELGFKISAQDIYDLRCGVVHSGTSLREFGGNVKNMKTLRPFVGNPPNLNDVMQVAKKRSERMFNIDILIHFMFLAIKNFTENIESNNNKSQVYEYVYRNINLPKTH